MTFLAPLAWAAGLLAVPIIILYLVRAKPRRLGVSNFLLWEPHPGRLRESALWRRLRRPLSLLLQLVFLALVIAALARPQATPEGGGFARVLVLDRSMSMGAVMGGGGTRFEAAKAALAGEIDAAGRVCILSTGSAPEVVTPWTESRRAARRALDAARVADGACDPRPAIALAKRLAGEVVFATDGVWDRELDPEFLEGVRVHRVGKPVPNAGITSFAARRSLAAPGQISVVAELGRSQPGGGNASISLFEGGRLADAREVAPDAADGWRCEWTFQSEAGSEFSLQVADYPSDGLAADNQAVLRVPPLRNVEVMLVSPPEPFLEAALEAMPAVSVVRVWPPDGIRFGDPSKAWIFRGVVPPDGFQSAFTLLIAPRESGFFGTLEGPPAPSVAVEYAAESPLLRFVSVSRLGLVEAAKFKPAEGAVTLVEGSDRPLAFGSPAGGWLVLAFDPASSDFVQRAAFPVLLANIVQTVRGETGGITSAPGLSAAATRLRSNTEAIAAPPAAPGNGGFPPWWWLLALAFAWVPVEWWLYHRRITE